MFFQLSNTDADNLYEKMQEMNIKPINISDSDKNNQINNLLEELVNIDNFINPNKINELFSITGIIE